MQNQLIFIHTFFYESFGFFKIAVIRYRKRYVVSSCGFDVVVGDDAVCSGAVGYHDKLVVAGADIGVKEFYLFDSSALTVAVDKVVDFIGAHDYNDNASGKVRKRALQRQTYCQTDGSNSCGNA